MPIYLQIDGIQGDATHEQHRKWMDIEAIHWNVSRNMNTSAGSAANREASEPTVSEVILTKVSDSSSTKLFQEACSGRTGKRATIHLVNLNPFESREVVLQAGAFGEHKFKTATYASRTSDYPGGVYAYAAPALETTMSTPPKCAVT